MTRKFVKVLITGLSNAGKTTIVEKLKDRRILAIDLDTFGEHILGHWYIRSDALDHWFFVAAGVAENIEEFMDWADEIIVLKRDGVQTKRFPSQPETEDWWKDVNSKHQYDKKFKGFMTIEQAEKYIHGLVDMTKTKNPESSIQETTDKVNEKSNPGGQDMKRLFSNKQGYYNKILRAEQDESESDAKARLEKDGWVFPAGYKYDEKSREFTLPE